MSINKRILCHFITCFIGIGIFILTQFYNISDGFWNGIAFAFIFSSIFRIFNVIKYKNDKNYAEKIDIQNNDERNIFLASKAKSIAFYVYIFICGDAVILLRLFGLEKESQIAAYSVCTLVVLYWISYIIVKKKY